MPSLVDMFTCCINCDFLSSSVNNQDERRSLLSSLVDVSQSQSQPQSQSQSQSQNTVDRRTRSFDLNRLFDEFPNASEPDKSNTDFLMKNNDGFEEKLNSLFKELGRKFENGDASGFYDLHKLFLNPEINNTFVYNAIKKSIKMLGVFLRNNPDNIEACFIRESFITSVNSLLSSDIHKGIAASILRDCCSKEFGVQLAHKSDESIINDYQTQLIDNSFFSIRDSDRRKIVDDFFEEKIVSHKNNYGEKIGDEKLGILSILKEGFNEPYNIRNLISSTRAILDIIKEDRLNRDWAVIQVLAALHGFYFEIMGRSDDNCVRKTFDITDKYLNKCPLEILSFYHALLLRYESHKNNKYAGDMPNDILVSIDSVLIETILEKNVNIFAVDFKREITNSILSDTSSQT